MALEADEGRLIGVFDGHLGKAMSTFAHREFPAELRSAAISAGATLDGKDQGSAWVRLESEGAARGVLDAAFTGCHEAARRQGKRGGTTAVVFWSCLVNGRKTGFCANAGDSRAVLRFHPPPIPRLLFARTGRTSLPCLPAQTKTVLLEGRNLRIECLPSQFYTNAPGCHPKGALSLQRAAGTATNVLSHSHKFPPFPSRALTHGDEEYADKDKAETLHN